MNQAEGDIKKKGKTNIADTRTHRYRKESRKRMEGERLRNKTLPANLLTSGLCYAPLLSFSSAWPSIWRHTVPWSWYAP